jgi:tetrapyrrole methylase family protein/MazG family protein
MKKTPAAGKGFSELIAIMSQLRGEQGCPWDREQTHDSLKSFLLEESYELLEAIERGNSDEMEEELGDLLHQILFHCQIASEQGHFSAEQVLTHLKEKLIRRHPHVFSGRSLPNSEAVLQHWVKAKAKEKGSEKADSSLGKLPRAMPALARAQKVGERASYFGFDWPGPEQAWDKIEEELSELKSAVSSGNNTRVGEEMGDLLFSVVNLCRFLKVEAELTLAQTITRFLKRFSYIESRLRAQGKSLSETPLAEVDSLWEEAKDQS